MNQKSVMIILAILVAALVYLVVSFDNKQKETIVPPPTTVLDQEVMEAEMSNQEESEAAEEIDPVPTVPQGKIDVRVACESALMYTTFIDGAAADAFVEECIAGEHPEVIERYLSDMNVDGAMI